MKSYSTCFLSVFFLSVAAFADPSPAELVKAADQFRGLQVPHSSLVKVLVQDGSSKNEQAYRVKFRDPETSLVEQVSPAKAEGRKLLMKGLDMWLFTPQLKKSVRISLQQRLTGDVSNGDISRTNYAQDYTATLAGKDEAQKAVILDLIANDKRVTYNKIKYWVQSPSGKPLKSEFYALSGKLMKTATFSDFKSVSGHEIMTKVVIQDAVSPSKKSVLLYSNQKPESFPDSVFNKEQMDR